MLISITQQGKENPKPQKKYEQIQSILLVAKTKEHKHQWHFFVEKKVCKQLKSFFNEKKSQQTSLKY